MDYITTKPTLYPGAFSELEVRVLKTIAKEIVWMPSPAALNFDQLRSLLALRNAGYIEYASYGGYRCKTNEYTVAAVPPAPDVRALLIAAGITPVSPVVECKDARRRSGNAISWLVVLPKGARIPANVWARFEDGAYRNGNILIVQLKSA